MVFRLPFLRQCSKIFKRTCSAKNSINGNKPAEPQTKLSNDKKIQTFPLDEHSPLKYDGFVFIKNGIPYVRTDDKVYKISPDNDTVVYNGHTISFRLDETQTAHIFPSSLADFSAYGHLLKKGGEIFFVLYGLETVKVPVPRALVPLNIRENILYCGKFNYLKNNIRCSSILPLAYDDKISTHIKALEYFSHIKKKTFLQDVTFFPSVEYGMQNHSFSNSRTNFTDTLTFVIISNSPEVKECAISFKRISNEHFELGVHVVDISDLIPDCNFNTFNMLLNSIETIGYSPSLKSLIRTCDLKIKNSYSFSHEKEMPSLSVLFSIRSNVVSDIWIGRGNISPKFYFDIRNGDFGELRFLSNNMEASNENNIKRFLRIVIKDMETAIDRMIKNYLYISTLSNTLCNDKPVVKISIIMKTLADLFVADLLTKYLQSTPISSHALFLSPDFHDYSVRLAFIPEGPESIENNSSLKNLFVPKLFRLRFFKLKRYGLCMSFFSCPLSRVMSLVTHYHLKELIYNIKTPQYISKNLKEIIQISNQRTMFLCDAHKECSLSAKEISELVSKPSVFYKRGCTVRLSNIYTPDIAAPVSKSNRITSRMSIFLNEIPCNTHSKS